MKRSTGVARNFTEAYIRDLEPTNQRLTFHDAKLKGLILIVFPGGTKTFYLYKRINGRPTRLLLGSWPALTAETARKAAALALAKIAQGENPHEEKQRKFEAATATLGDVWARYKDVKFSRSRRSTVVTHESRFQTCLSEWVNRRLDSITRADVVALHATIGRDRGNVTANRAIQLLRAIFNFAVDKLGLDTLRNPAAKVELFHEHSRERFLKYDELKKFFEAVAQEPDQDFRDLFVLLLFTGARRGNVCSMRWDDIDFAAKVWVIPADTFKAKRVMRIPLVGPAADILERRKQYIAGEYVFPRNSIPGHMVDPAAAWRRLLERSGLNDLRMHDLRRSLGSWQAAAGVPLNVIGASLGHSQIATTQIYARLTLDPIREAMSGAVNAMLKAAEKETDNKS